MYLNFVMGIWWANLPVSLYPTVKKCSESVSRKKTEWEQWKCFFILPFLSLNIIYFIVLPVGIYGRVSIIRWRGLKIWLRCFWYEEFLMIHVNFKIYSLHEMTFPFKFFGILELIMCGTNTKPFIQKLQSTFYLSYTMVISYDYK